VLIDITEGPGGAADGIGSAAIGLARLISSSYADVGGMRSPPATSRGFGSRCATR
jgi:hypothetical protein